MPLWPAMADKLAQAKLLWCWSVQKKLGGGFRCCCLLLSGIRQAQSLCPHMLLHNLPAACVLLSHAAVRAACLSQLTVTPASSTLRNTTCVSRALLCLCFCCLRAWLPAWQQDPEPAHCVSFFLLCLCCLLPACLVACSSAQHTRLETWKSIVCGPRAMGGVDWPVAGEEPGLRPLTCVCALLGQSEGHARAGLRPCRVVSVFGSCLVWLVEGGVWAALEQCWHQL